MTKRFDPRTIFLSTLFLAVSLVVMNKINQTIFCALAIILHVLLIGINIKNIIKIFIASIWLLLSIILINYFLIGRNIDYIANTAFRLFGIIILAAAVLSSMDIMDIGFAIEKIFYPLKYLKIPIESISIIIALSLKFIPLIKDEALRIRKAQKARGLDYQLMPIGEKITNSANLFIPIVILAIQSSVKTAVAMEVRGYSAPYDKTRLYESFIKVKDVLYISFSILFLVFIILVRLNIIKILDNIKL
ncbi:energy-coupling factor transporter transmembrane component T family protein [Brachyspira murdochii]|uniref:Cobalt transporter n=1 Tax=Brachyspira murdochii TaxID=84378 RepID=A0ABX5B2R7_9SPIR|nr:energy-coupling factor transporter transmembrane component T [Brachyspira murdochii]PPS21565.1 cobalt transporter [Brachyspira murdochii]